MVGRLDDERGWNLGERGRTAYVDALLPHIPPDCDDAALAARVEYYRLDHEVVRALLDDRHPAYQEAWTQWVELTLRIVRSRVPRAPAHSAVEAHDLAQEGLAALGQSIPRYHYESRFSTWAYAVVMRTVYRTVRNLNAAKRTAHVESVERQTELGVILAAPSDLDDIIAVRALHATIEEILRAQPDARLALIFRLWAIHDQPVAAIARWLNLSVSRVSSLLADIRELLRAHPQIANWRAEQAASGSEHGSADSADSTL